MNHRCLTAFAAAAWLASSALLAQVPRIRRAVDDDLRVRIAGTVHPLARPEFDQGQVDRGLNLGPITMTLSKTPAQQAELDRLLAAQQDPSSPLYHRWLTPEQYAERFGASPEDLEKIADWLRSQGLAVIRLSRGRDSISFHGSAAQVQKALQTEIHSYRAQGGSYYANATEPAVPQAFSGLVTAFRGLDDFRPPARRRSARSRAGLAAGGLHRQATTHQFGAVLSPADLATIYNIAPFYASGLDGAGQKIVVIGNSDIDLADIQAFRKTFGLPANDPQKVLVPGFENPGIIPDRVEEDDLDVEWAGAIAPRATLIFVYAPVQTPAVEYAVDNALAPVMSYSFLRCEALESPAAMQADRSLAQKANAEGITWLACTGDNGAAACEVGENSDQATTGQQVAEPADIPEVTAVGGTEFAEGEQKYWDANGSALSYIPEIALGRDLHDAAGGGLSWFFPRPEWQRGPGVPGDNRRAVPDVALAASIGHDPYVIVTSGYLEPISGTSAATPVFAGIVVLLNQYLVSKGIQAQPGLGNINPALYRLAEQNRGVFHDITAGNNKVPCQPGSPDCTDSSLGYTAGPGYDLATGLGSVDAYKLATEWTNAGAGAPPGPAHLVVTGLASEPSVTPGGNLPVAALIENHGKTDAGAFLTGFYLIPIQPDSEPQPYFATCATDALAAGKTAKCSGALQVPSLPVGQYSFVAVADVENKVPQSDRSGATRFSGTGPVTVYVPATK